MKLGIKNKVAIVTGVATGIGFSIAYDLAKEGCNVVISSRNKNFSLSSGSISLKPLIFFDSKSTISD